MPPVRDYYHALTILCVRKNLEHNPYRLFLCSPSCSGFHLVENQLGALRDELGHAMGTRLRSQSLRDSLELDFN